MNKQTEQAKAQIYAKTTKSMQQTKKGDEFEKGVREYEKLAGYKIEAGFYSWCLTFMEIPSERERLNNRQNFEMIEKIKNNIKMLDDNSGTKLKGTVLNDLTLLQNIFLSIKKQK